MANSLYGLLGQNQTRTESPIQLIQQMQAQRMSPIQIAMQLKMMGVDPNSVIKQMMGAGMVTQQQYDAAAAQAPNVKI